MQNSSIKIKRLSKKNAVERLKVQNLNNSQNLTLDAQHLLKTGIGYRVNDNDIVEDEQLLMNKINYEIQDLENTDIIDTLYMLTDNQHLDCLTYLQKIAVTYPYALWLCNQPQTAVNFYGYNEDKTFISRYQLTGCCYLLSDIGNEGTLLAIPHKPQDYLIKTEVYK